jgi:hypothetical protein
MFNICTEEASIVNLIYPEQDFFQFNSFFHLSLMFVGVASTLLHYHFVLKWLQQQPH